MTIRQIIEERKAEVLRAAAEHGVRRIRIFGSGARGDERPDSDVDFLVEAGTETSPWFPAGLILDLEKLLGRRVDVVTEKGLHPLLRERVLREAVPL